MYKHQSTSNTDRIIREAERKRITSVSRTWAWSLEQKGQFPKRRRLNPEGSSCGWLLSEILEWCHSREVVNPVDM